MPTTDRRLPLSLVAVGLLAIAACSPSKRSYKMPSGSMIPTLAPGAGFVVDTSVKVPARGEVWALHSPEHPEQEFVKRIVGLAGDRVEMRGDTLVLNGNPVSSCVVGAFSSKDDNAAHPGRLVLEKLDAQVFLTFIEDLATPTASGPWVTAAGELFVVGDNRRNSLDSRMWRGGLGAGAPVAQVIGRAEMPPVALPPGAEGLAAAFEKCKAELSRIHD